jgi:hypothetical protein
MRATAVLPRLRFSIVAALLAAAGACREPTAPSSAAGTYFLVSIEGVTGPVSELLYLYSDGHFLHDPAPPTLSASGVFTSLDSSITMTFSCGQTPHCFTTWRGTLEGQEPPALPLLVLHEDNGSGRRRTYQRGGEL